ncbi:PR-1-like protein [Auricularia subglabra TFB-10046 SS5]|uniref:PR-1-like protein n=1 Tax=Auricularia subglabra (strain TFB-10046 / SS5) TaxID=717982 RepID=J0WLK6_AURST|nr:PR-1-like protein [Auricularia subglabra TFB-10046 SS5]
MLAALFLVSLLSSGLAAPTVPGHTPHILAKRSLLWPGRLFGGDRWGVVIGPPPADVLDNPADKTASAAGPAINPAAAPSGGAPVVPTSTTLASLTTKAPNGFQALKPTASRSLQPSSLTSSVLSTPSTRTTRPPSTSKAPPKPTSTSTSKPPSTPKPSSTPSPKPTSSPSPTPKPTPKPSSTTKQPTPAPTSGSGGSGGTPSADIAEYLKGHNDERAKHGAAPLSWNETLAGKAQQWANNCQFKHSGGTLGPFGENLAAGTGSFSLTDGIRAWNDEAPDYDPSNPQASHWTQVVWKSSNQVGCAVQRCTGIFGSSVANYFVCEYSPQGNFIGRFPENVQK